MNKAILMGRLTRDVELRETHSGIPVVMFTLAVDRRYRSSSGEREADFISCKAFRQTAEFIGKWFSKGSRILVEGTIQTGSYEKDGRKIYTTDVIVDQAYFVDPARSDANYGKIEEDNSGMDYTQDSTALPFDL